MEKLSKAGMVERGYAQVEPNHLSAQRTGQIYAQLPAKKDIKVLENGMFVKYNYAKGEVDFDKTTGGEWMLVYNEIKLYRENMPDCAFAMKRGDYYARIYSPAGGTDATKRPYPDQTRFYGGTGWTPKDDGTVDPSGSGEGDYGWNESATIEKVTAPADPYEPNYNEDPFHLEPRYAPLKMDEFNKEKSTDASSMVPRVFKTNVGDIFTTNAIKEETLELGDIVTPGAAGDEYDGYLTKTDAPSADMQWQVVKVYTVPDGQKGVKLVRIK